MPKASDSPETTEILIVGAGPAGLSLALALAQGGFEVMLSDVRALPGRSGASAQKNTAKSNDGRVYLISEGCWRLFRALGVEADLAPNFEAVTEVAARGSLGGVSFLGADAGENEALGHVISGGDLESGLAAAAMRESRIRILAPSVVDGLRFEEGAALAQIDGRAVRARLVVGCDGGRSMVRSAAGIRFEGWDYPYKAVSAVMSVPTPHEGVARQVFLPGGPIAALPMTANRINLVWSVKASVADALIAMSDGDFEAELERQAEGFLSGAKVVGQRGAFALGNRIAERFHGVRVALAGDSAHQVHPLAGQGLNLGLKDVAALVDVIQDAARVGLDIGSETALAPYTQWRRADVVSTAAAMEAFHRAFTAPAPVRFAASLAMQAAGSAQAARGLFAREAVGATGDVPSLMQPGEAPSSSVA